MANFCSNCGSSLHPEDKFCLNCGTRLHTEPTSSPGGTGAVRFSFDNAPGTYTSNPTSYQPNTFTGTPKYGAVPCSHPLVRMLSDKVRIMGMLWLAVGILQILLGFVYLNSSDYSSTSLNEIGGISVIVIGVLNIAISVQNLSYSNSVLQSPVGIVDKFTPLAGAAGTFIYNLFFGGVIGIIGSVYYFLVRSFVMANADQFLDIERNSR